jgi:hypothetical protein
MGKIARPINKEGHLFECEKVHISQIRQGDTVFHNGESKTVGKNSLKYNSFCGYTLFGDSYLLGRRPVIRFITVEGGKLVAAE